MSIQSIVFKAGPYRNSNGIALPSSSYIPSDVEACSPDDAIAKLDEALESLASIPCVFWACEGPDNPKDMVTCSKCWAMINIKQVRELLAKSC